MNESSASSKTDLYSYIAKPEPPVLVTLSRGLEGAEEKEREKKKKNLGNNQKAVQVEMSFPLFPLLLPSTDTLNTRRVEMCFGFALEEKSYQITSFAFHFKTGSHLST